MTELQSATNAPILHHYWGSPYAEKIRLLFGYKAVAWRSCEIPVTPPRPHLARVLGAFRRTPVLQLGADFICDTRLIAEVVDDIVPEPSLGLSRNNAMSQLICHWAEPRVFALLGPVRFRSADDVAGIFNGAVGVTQFGTDRMPFMHPVYDAARFGKLNASSWDQLNLYMQTLESFFGEGAEFIGGGRPAFGDFSAYHNVWWLRTPPAHMECLARFPAIAGWADRMAVFGHGNHRPIGSEESLAVAVAASRANEVFSPSWDEQPDRRMHRVVEIVADDYGKDPIDGKVVAMSERHVAIERHADGIGAVRVHFPRTATRS